MHRPEQVKVIIETNDGGVSVMSFVTVGYNMDGTIQFQREASDENVDAEIIKSRLDCKSWRFLEEGEEVPTDRTFRDAWIDGLTKIDVDMVKAREIQKDRLRYERAPLLEKLDVDYMKALESGNTILQAAITAEKTLLRDITKVPQIAKAKTPEELKAITVATTINKVSK
mgnify:CR=1 FL=1